MEVIYYVLHIYFSYYLFKLIYSSVYTVYEYYDCKWTTIGWNYQGQVLNTYRMNGFLDLHTLKQVRITKYYAPIKVVT